MRYDTENPWKLYAEQIGATYRLSDEGMSEVIGHYQNFPFVMKMILVQAAPKVNLFLTHIDITLDNKVDLKLKIYREGIIQKLTKLFGTQDIIFKDRTFDKKYIIEGSDEPLVIQVVSPSVRAKIIELGEILMILDGNTLTYEQSGKVIDFKKLALIFDMLTELATNIQSLVSGH